MAIATKLQTLETLNEFLLSLTTLSQLHIAHTLPNVRLLNLWIQSQFTTTLRLIVYSNVSR